MRLVSFSRALLGSAAVRELVEDGRGLAEEDVGKGDEIGPSQV